MFNVKLVIYQVFHDKNKFHFDQIVMIRFSTRLTHLFKFLQ